MFWDANTEDFYVDVEEIRRRLEDEYGTGMYAGGGPAAFADLMEVEDMSDDQLIEEARRRGWI